MKSIVTENNHMTTIKDVLKQEAHAIMRLTDDLSYTVSSVIDHILACKGRVIVTGVGKSGIIGKKITATLASTGTPAMNLHPTEGLHGDLGMVTQHDIILALSKSGETEEVLNIIPSIKRIGSKIIALVESEYSTLAEKADYVISIGKTKEACPLGLAPTTSTTLMLTLGDAISIALLNARNFSLEEFAVFHPGGLLGKRLLFTVDSIVKLSKKNPLSQDNSTVKDVIFQMTECGLGASSIIDENDKLIGIITDGDIRRFLSSGKILMNSPIERLYNNHPITVRSNILAVEALNIMEVNNINVLPVVDSENKPVAMIHLHDLTRLGF